MSVGGARPARVWEVMTPSVVSVTPDTHFKDVVLALSEHRISAVPVVDPAEGLIGVVSEADLLRREEERSVEGGGSTAGELMTAPAVTIEPDASLASAARLIRVRRVRRLCVVDHAGRLLGIVSRADLIGVFLRSDESIRDEVEESLAPWTRDHAASLAVAVEEGVVRITGNADRLDFTERDLTGLAGAVDGVVRVDVEVVPR
jgi:CBS domain-containing protein